MIRSDVFLSSGSLGDTDRLLSVIKLFEGDFSIDWIIHLGVMNKPSKVLSKLEELTQGGLLQRKQIGFYSLSNSSKLKKIQELPSHEQIKFNRCIAEYLIADNIEDEKKAKTISYYLKKIPNDLNECRWLKKAGDLFLKTFDVERALECYLKIFKDLPRNECKDAQLLYIETAIQYSKISIAKQKTSNVLSVLERALDLATALNIPTYCALLNANIANYEWLMSKDDCAIKHFRESQSIAQNLEESDTLGKIDKYGMYFYYWQGRYKEAIECYERYMPAKMEFPESKFHLVSLYLISFCYARRGEVSRGLGMLDSLKRHSKEIKDHYLESYVEGTIGLLMLDIARKKEALHYLESGLKLAIREHNVLMKITCNLGLAVCYYLTGKCQNSIECLKNYLDLATKVQIDLRSHPYLLMLCWIIEQGGLPPLPNLSLKEEIHRALSSKNVFSQGIAYRFQALIDRKKGDDHKKVLKSLNLSTELLNISGSKIEEAKTQLEIVRQYLISGKDAVARQTAISVSEILSPINEALIPDDLKAICNIDKHMDKFLVQEMFQIGQEIVNSRNKKDMMKKITASMHRVTGAERSALFLKNGKKLELNVSINITSEQITHSDFASSMKVIQEVSETSTGVIKGENLKGIKNGENIRSSICVPMILRNHLIGVIYHDNRLLGNIFKKRDMDLIKYFATIAAVVYDNITSYEEVHVTKKRIMQEKLCDDEQHFSEIHKVNIIGKSIPIEHVLKYIQQAASTDANVIILGETGVGKELVASAIHKNSNRKNKPFITVQCSALPEKLLPSELFGHEKGAFTGATGLRIGRFELADKGIIFLDEIGELKLDLQIQLLRVLQTKQFERIGGIKTIQSDFRLIAATNRDLEGEVKAGRFRMDLYYRLNVFPIYVPPLRDRKSDIPLLVDHFAKLHAKKLGKVFDGVFQEDIKRLLEYDWPGNIRELENIVERAVIISKSSMLHFPEIVHRFTNIPFVESNDITLKENERRHIVSALQKTNWKVDGNRGAAKLLDINPSTLIFRMKKLGIKKPL